MVAPALIRRTAPIVGDRPAQPQGKRRPGRARTSSSGKSEGEQDSGETLGWSDLDPTTPLLEALDRIRTIEPGRPGDSEDAKVLRARRAYQETITERLARLESGLD